MQILLVSLQAHNYYDNSLYNNYALLLLASAAPLVRYCNSADLCSSADKDYLAYRLSVFNMRKIKLKLINLSGIIKLAGSL